MYCIRLVVANGLYGEWRYMAACRFRCICLGVYCNEILLPSALPTLHLEMI